MDRVRKLFSELVPWAGMLLFGALWVLGVFAALFVAVLVFRFFGLLLNDGNVTPSDRPQCFRC